MIHIINSNNTIDFFLQKSEVIEVQKNSCKISTSFMNVPKQALSREKVKLMLMKKVSLLVVLSPTLIQIMVSCRPILQTIVVRWWMVLNLCTTIHVFLSWITLAKSFKHAYYTLIPWQRFLNQKKWINWELSLQTTQRQILRSASKAHFISSVLF